MPKLKPLTPKELIRLIEKRGFRFQRQKGSHAVFIGPGNRILVIPIHTGKKIDRGLLLRIIKKELGMTRAQFEEQP